MGGIDYKGIKDFLLQYHKPYAKKIVDKKGMDLNGDNKIKGEEVADLDGNGKVDGKELFTFYQKHRIHFPKGELTDYVFSTIDTMAGVKPKAVISPEQADQKEVDRLIKIVLDTSKGQIDYKKRLSAAKELITILSKNPCFSKESLLEFAKLYTLKVQEIEQTGVEDTLKRNIYDLLIKTRIGPGLGPIYHAAIGYRCGLKINLAKSAFSSKDIKIIAEALYDRYENGTPEVKAEINEVVKRAMLPVKLVFFAKAVGNKGMGQAVKDHNFVIGERFLSIRFLSMIIKEKDTDLVPSDVRTGAFKLFASLTNLKGVKYAKELLKLLQFGKAMRFFIRKEALQIARSQYKPDTSKKIPILDDLYSLVVSLNQTKNWEAGRDAERIFRHVLQELSGTKLEFGYANRDSYKPLKEVTEEEYDGIVEKIKDPVIKRYYTKYMKSKKRTIQTGWPLFSETSYAIWATHPPIVKYDGPSIGPMTDYR